MLNEVAIAPTQPRMISNPPALELPPSAVERIQPATVIKHQITPNAHHAVRRARTPAYTGAQAPSPSGSSDTNGQRGRCAAAPGAEDTTGWVGTEVTGADSRKRCGLLTGPRTV